MKWNNFLTFRRFPVPLKRDCRELQSLSREHETGNPLAGLSGAQRARRGWVCHLATVPRYRGIGSEAYLNGTSQGPIPEDARKHGHIRGRSK